ncbi:hypothetical protein VIGAN_03093400 [Vigna angularis var. angularis]|uniref:Uncharacterized protein n=1 Tax=Vigna angularis var. angularis TaxID=157739 RepID=A0A0S3RL38_PHAAN|nr:hypothetical protein VIGAN_03093400 [Vigna angularis var. angularis]
MIKSLTSVYVMFEFRLIRAAEHLGLQIVNRSAHTVARQLHTRSHACFSVRSVVPNAYAFLLVHTATSNFALVTTPGRPRKDDPNALKPIIPSFADSTFCSYNIYIFICITL